MSRFFVKYSYFLLVLPVLLLLLSIKANLESNFTPERVLYTYLILYLASILFLNKKIKFIYISLVYVFSVLFTYLEWCYVMLYHERINTSTIFILLETNGVESLEFVRQYFDYRMIFVLLVLVFSSFFILKGVKILIENYSIKEILLAIKSDFLNLFNNRVTIKIGEFSRFINANTVRKLVFGLFILSIIVFIYFKSNHQKQHAVYLAYDSYLKYKEEQKKYHEFLFGDQKNHDYLQGKSNNSPSEKETYVLVIGESTTRTHFQLYNYNRATNPELAKIKNELVIFEDVISPHTHTIPCLEKMLTLGNYEQPNKKYEGTIIEIMKQAGFKTYWISNQIPVGIYETKSTAIAKLSDNVFFTNSGGEMEQQSLDEKVLPYVDKVLKENVTKKFIVVHLLGTHVQYENRYPNSFDVFKDTPQTDFPSDDAHKTINYYDNAVLYNDYIVSTIIDKVKATTINQKSSLIYLSDHGEDVFETVDLSGHSEAISSKPMYLVPFIYWSNNAEQLKKLQQYKQRKYMADDLIFSLADMANLTFNGNEPKRSIFNLNFKERIRRVKDGKDFDELFQSIN
jgi:heptose-I-phosphate ethanolaminephosphotransferase